MSRYTDPVCRRCRRENIKLYLKGDRCYSEKCAFERRAYAPGAHGQARFKKQSDYAIQLREKQKVKRMYGMQEGQFRRYFVKADSMKGVTGENLLMLLECRLDNVVYRLGMAASRDHARQLVRHNHIRVNDRTVNIPSFQVVAGDILTMKDKSAKNELVAESLEAVARRGVPAWLELDRDACKGTVKQLPCRDDIAMPIQEQLIVELYSK